MIPTGVATSVSAITLQYKDINGAMQTATQGFAAVPTGSAPYATATFTGLTMYVPANSATNLDVYVNIPTVPSGATSGAAISVVLSNIKNAYNGNGFHDTDSSGSSNTTFTCASCTSSMLASTATSGQGQLVVRQSKPTLTAVALSTTALQNGSGVAIGRVNIAADPAGDVGWGKIVFYVSKDATTKIGATSTLAYLQRRV